MMHFGKMCTPMDQLLVLALMAVSSNCNLNPQEQRTFDDLLVAFG
jgi:hypothetical protein